MLPWVDPDLELLSRDVCEATEAADRYDGAASVPEVTARPAYAQHELAAGLSGVTVHCSVPIPGLTDRSVCAENGSGDTVQSNQGQHNRDTTRKVEVERRNLPFSGCNGAP